MSRGDKWLVEHETANSKASEAEAAINERDRLQRTGQSTTKVTSQIRRLLNELSMNVSQLEDALNIAGRDYHITDAEFNRRQNMVATLKGRREHLQSKFSSDGGGGGGGPSGGYGVGGRNELFGGRESGMDRRGPRQEGEDTRGYDNHGMLERQQQIMREQDKGLDILQQSIARQKNMGLSIGNELEDQNEMLDELAEAMDNTDRRLVGTTGHVMRVTEKAKSGGMCCCIILLIVAIVVVGVI